MVLNGILASLALIFYVVVFSLSTHWQMFKETKPGLTFIVLPVPVSNQDFMSRMFKRQLAWTDINGSYALIYMTGIGSSNKHTFAHETGHMMGLPHRGGNITRFSEHWILSTHNSWRAYDAGQYVAW